MKKTIILCTILYSMIYAEIEDSTKVNNSIEDNISVSFHLTENSHFPIILAEFIGKLSNNDNAIVSLGIGPGLRNNEWRVEYYVSPITFLYRKNLDDSFMFYDVGASAAVLLSDPSAIEEQVLSAFYPEFGIGIRLNKLKNPFLLRLCVGYNLIDRPDEYYPNGLIWKYVAGFNF